MKKMLKFVSTSVAALGLSCVMSVTAMADFKLVDEIVAVVNEEVVLKTQLDDRVQEIRARYASNPNVLPPVDQLQTQILELLVTESIQLQMADRMGIDVTDQQLNDALNRMASSRNLTLAQFKSSAGKEFDRIQSSMGRQLKINMVRQRIVSRRIQVNQREVDAYLDTKQGRAAQAPEIRLAYISVASEEAADQLYQRLNSGASLLDENNAKDLGWRRPEKLPSLFQNLNLAEVDTGFVVAPISANEKFHIAQVMEKRSSQLKLVEQVDARHILIKPSAVINSEQAKVLLEEIRNRVVAGESFANLAREFSDDTGSGSEGGDLGWQDPATFVPEFTEMVKKTPIDEFSPVFETQFGFHFLQVKAKRQMDISEDELRNQARQTLFSNKFNEELQRWLTEIRQQAFVEFRS